MIIRRAARFGTKIGLNEPFLGKIAEEVINIYGNAYKDLKKNKKTILDNIYREELRFKHTLESGLLYLEETVEDLDKRGEKILSGKEAFELYATHGLPFEITRDILKERGLDVDFIGFEIAMKEHREASGAGQTMGKQDSEETELYSEIFSNLLNNKALTSDGVDYNPYDYFDVDTKVLSLVIDGNEVNTAKNGDNVNVIISRTGFYLESGGQVSDIGIIKSHDDKWEIIINNVYKPSAGIIVHSGVVTKGNPQIGENAKAVVDLERRNDIARNHTATHLLHAELQKILGPHARQAGSLVAPDRLRFDFTHPKQISKEELYKIEKGVNENIYNDQTIDINFNKLEDAINEGAMALFGEKYGENVRTVSIGKKGGISYELCGGTHVNNTSDIGIFLILSESSTAAGIRRIEAVTGRGAYNIIAKKNKILDNISETLETSNEEIGKKIEGLLSKIDKLEKDNHANKKNLAIEVFKKSLAAVELVEDINILSTKIPDADMDTLREISDIFRNKFNNGIIVLGSVVESRPILVTAVSKDVVEKGIRAGDIIKEISKIIEGSGGGKPNLAMAGGKNPNKLDKALSEVIPLIKNNYLK